MLAVERGGVEPKRGGSGERRTVVRLQERSFNQVSILASARLVLCPVSSVVNVRERVGRWITAVKPGCQSVTPHLFPSAHSSGNQKDLAFCLFVVLAESLTSQLRNLFLIHAFLSFICTVGSEDRPLEMFSPTGGGSNNNGTMLQHVEPISQRTL